LGDEVRLAASSLSTHHAGRSPAGSLLRSVSSEARSASSFSSTFISRRSIFASRTSLVRRGLVASVLDDALSGEVGSDTAVDAVDEDEAEVTVVAPVDTDDWLLRPA
jgi:hypothetical protein